jgi:hypothetical protein
VALAAVAVAGAVPLWCARFLPFADMPQQVAAISMLRHWWDPAFRLRELYTLNVGDSQYVLYHAAGALLSLFTGSAESANRVLLSAVAVSYPYALRSLLRALERDERLALFGAPMFWSAPLLMGFVPYVAAVPVATWGIALAVRQARAPTRRRAAGLAVLACALFGLHLSAFVVMLGASAAVAAVVDARAAPRRLTWTAPSFLLAIAWAARRGIAVQEMASGALPREPVDVHFLGAGALTRALPIWAHDIWRSHVDEACAIVLWVAFVALLFRRGPRPADARVARAAWAPLVVAAVAYALLPYHVGVAVMLDVRMATFVVLFAPLVLSPPRGWAGSVPIAALVVVQGVSVVDSCIEVRRAEREELGDIDRLVDRMPPGTRVLTLPFHLTSAHTHWPPWTFFGSYHVARSGGRADMSFTELRHWPIHDRPGADVEREATLPARRPFWTFAPCDFRNAIDGRRLDYVLVRGARDPFRAEPEGPRWHVVDRERDWTLYERVPGDEWPSTGAVDPGPCAKLGDP